MFGIFGKATSKIKDRANEAIHHGIDLATDTILTGKDSAQSKLIKKGMNVAMKKFGEVKDLKFDTKNKSITLTVYLKGEKQDVVLNIDSYKFSKDDDDNYYIEIFTVSANRYWMDALVRTFLIGRKFPIPSQLVVPMKILM
jgi:hypothetical protein